MKEEQKYRKLIASLSEMWTSSYIYYDEESDEFVEECYHEEYLDTGTVFDGCFTRSEENVWNKLVKACDDRGISSYLKIRGKAPDASDIGETITLEEFKDGIFTLKRDKPWYRCYLTCFGATIIITDESREVWGIVGKTEHYCFFFDPRSDVERKGFHTWEEALAYALKRATEYHKFRMNHIEENKFCAEDNKVRVEDKKRSFLERFKGGRKR